MVYIDKSYFPKNIYKRKINHYGKQKRSVSKG